MATRRNGGRDFLVEHNGETVYFHQGFFRWKLFPDGDGYRGSRRLVITPKDAGLQTAVRANLRRAGWQYTDQCPDCRPGIAFSSVKAAGYPRGTTAAKDTYDEGLDRRKTW